MMTTSAQAILAKHLRTKPAAAASSNGDGNGKPGLPTNFEGYYDALRKAYFCQNTRGDWIELSEKNLERLLREAGFKRDVFHDSGLSYAEGEILRITRQNDVCYAGELAGYDAGIHEICGQRILVTKSRHKIAAKKTGWQALKLFLKNLLGKEVVYLHGWLKASLQALEGGATFRPGQCLVIAGPAGAGKNLLQNLITELFGKREAKPYRYMSGQTTFNGDLFRAEHLVIQDEPASSDLRTRRMFGANIKAFTVNQDQSFHPKGKQAIQLSPFWRLSITLNEDPEHLLVLPPLDDSLLDKIILLRCQKQNMPFQAGDDDGRKKFRDSLSAALPGYVHWLRRWPVPRRLQDQRFGILAYQNAELVGALNDLSPEFKLLQLVDTGNFFDDFCSMLEVTANELEKKLKESHGAALVERLLTWPGACGVYLSRLAKRNSERVTRCGRRNNAEVWKITFPR